jgi:hypothetical protein
MEELHLPTTVHDPPTQANFDELSRWTSRITEELNDRPSVRVGSSVTVATVTDEERVLPFNIERWDTEELHAAGSTRLTCVKPGLYEIYASVGFEASGVGVRRLVTIRLNGATRLNRANAGPVDAGIRAWTSLSTRYQLARGDYVELIALQNSGGALNIASEASVTPEFGMDFVRP